MNTLRTSLAWAAIAAGMACAVRPPAPDVKSTTSTAASTAATEASQERRAAVVERAPSKLHKHKRTTAPDGTVTEEDSDLTIGASRRAAEAERLRQLAASTSSTSAGTRTETPPPPAPGGFGWRWLLGSFGGGAAAGAFGLWRVLSFLRRVSP
jgi:hypothetical protein